MLLCRGHSPCLAGEFALTPLLTDLMSTRFRLVCAETVDRHYRNVDFGNGILTITDILYEVCACARARARCRRPTVSLTDPHFCRLTDQLMRRANRPTWPRS